MKKRMNIILISLVVLLLSATTVYAQDNAKVEDSLTEITKYIGPDVEIYNTYNMSLVSWHFKGIHFETSKGEFVYLKGPAGRFLFPINSYNALCAWVDKYLNEEGIWKSNGGINLESVYGDLSAHNIDSPNFNLYEPLLPPETDENTSIWLWIGVGAGACLIISAITFCVIKRKRRMSVN